jgi:hypothetical protein
VIIALDYDDTFTEDREGWGLFVNIMKNRGHDISFVTFRDPALMDQIDITTDSEQLGIPIVYTYHRQKRHVFKADVWIDDMPEVIVAYEELDKIKRGCELMEDTFVRI